MSAYGWAAGWFFRSGMRAMALLSLAVAKSRRPLAGTLDKRRRVLRRFALPGTVTTLTSAAFRCTPTQQPSDATAQALNAGPAARPARFLRGHGGGADGAIEILPPLTNGATQDKIWSQGASLVRQEVIVRLPVGFRKAEQHD